jgi:hypothetical protein
MAQSLDCTCLQGLELALKWAERRCDPEFVRCTAAIAHECLHRDDCCQRDRCDVRLHQIEDWLTANSGKTGEERAN